MIKTSTCLIANNAIYIKKDKSENGMIRISDVPEYVQEMLGAVR